MRAVIFFILFGIDNCISDIYDKLFIPAYISLSIFLVLGVLLTLISIKKLHPENNGLKD
jgi:putative membrane protein